MIAPQVVSSFPTPGGQVRGMAWGDGSLWFADENRMVYRLSPTGEVQASWFHGIFDISDLAWFEDSVWLHNGSNTYKFSPSGTLLETLPVGIWAFSGMEWAEGDLYVGDYNSSDIHKYDRAGNHILSWPTFPPIFGHPQDFVYDGESLWVTDSCEGSTSNRLWQFSLLGQPGQSVDLERLRTAGRPIRVTPSASRGTAATSGTPGCSSSTSSTSAATRSRPRFVVSPNGGEYWLLSEAGSPAHQQVVTWSMSDNVRICQVEVVAPVLERRRRHLPRRRPRGAACRRPSVRAGPAGRARPWPRPASPTPSPRPSLRASPGRLYKVRVRVTDHVGLQATALMREPVLHRAPEPRFGEDPDPVEHGAHADAAGSDADGGDGARGQAPGSWRRTPACRAWWST